MSESPKAEAPPASKTDVNVCMEEIVKILDKYNCELVSMPHHVDDGRGGWVLTTPIQIKKKRDK